MSDKKPRRVLIGTPAYDGKVDAAYAISLANTIRMCPPWVSISSCLHSYQPILQLARNAIITIAVENGFDDLIFIDSDMAWEPEWVFSLLNREEQVVGGTARRKEEAERYAVHVLPGNTAPKSNGLVQTGFLGTGFLRIGREALMAVWNASVPYSAHGRNERAVCEVGVIDGHFYSEDVYLCRKLAAAGYQVWLDPSMTCRHIGTKEYKGDVAGFLQRISSQKTPAPDSSASE